MNWALAPVRVKHLTATDYAILPHLVRERSGFPVSERAERPPIGDVVRKKLAQQPLMSPCGFPVEFAISIVQPASNGSPRVGRKPPPAGRSGGTSRAEYAAGPVAEIAVLAIRHGLVTLGARIQRRREPHVAHQPPQRTQRRRDGSLAVGAGNSRERLQKAIVDAWRRLLVHNPQGTLGEGGRCAESFEVSGQQRLRPGDVKTRERVQVASWSYVDLRDPDGKQIDGTAKAFTGVPRAASDHRLDARITRRETQDAGRFQIVRHVQHDRVGAKQGHSWRIPCADAAGEWRPFARTPVRRASGALSNRQIDAALPCGDAANLPAVGVEDEQ